MKTFVTLAIIIFLVGAACAPIYQISTTTGNEEQFTVLLQPKSGDEELKVKSGPQGWGKGGKKDGYVGFDVGDYGTIIFAIKGEDPGNKCADEDGAKWVITEIKLSDEGDASTEKGNNFNAEQDEWLIQAFPGTAKSTGVRFSVNKDQGITSVVVINKNDHPKAWGLKTAYYEVTASECSGDDTVTTDPGVGNRGK